jgi:hypothetical protein
MAPYPDHSITRLPDYPITRFLSYCAVCVSMNDWFAMLMEAVRAAPVAFTAAAKVTCPFPVPDAPPVIDSHSGLLDAAVHAHEPPAVTEIEPGPPAAPSVWLPGAIEKVHGAGCCVTVRVWPPMVIVPLRATPGFAAALKMTTPFPVPDVPAVTVIHGAFDVAVHAQPTPADTFVRPSPPAAGRSTVAGESE